MSGNSNAPGLGSRTRRNCPLAGSLRGLGYPFLDNLPYSDPSKRCHRDEDRLKAAAVICRALSAIFSGVERECCRTLRTAGLPHGRCYFVEANASNLKCLAGLEGRPIVTHRVTHVPGQLSEEAHGHYGR
jgi:hypothetical protein